MALYYVDCINKDPRNDPYSSIDFLGGTLGFQRWKMHQTVVIKRIKAGDVFKVRGMGLLAPEVKIIIAISPRGNEYVKTERDKKNENNLLSLPECLPESLFG